MKKGNALLWLFMFYCIAVNAQDMAISDIRITSDSNNNAPIGVETSVEVTLINTDSINIPAGDSMLLEADVNGELLSLQYTLIAPLDSGSELNINFGADQLILIDTSMILSITGSITYFNDSNSTNDTLSEVFAASTSLNNDWACTGITIIAPANLDTIDLDNNTNLPPALQEVSIELTNQGEVTYLAWSSLHYSIWIEDEIADLEVNLNAAGTSPGEVQIRTISNQSLLPSIPDSVGVYALCGISTQPQDANTENDLFCLTIPVVDNFDPTDPFNWPTGEGEQVNAPNKAYDLLWNGHSQQLSASSDLNYRLYNALGGQLGQGQVHSGGVIRFDGMSSGVYLLQIQPDGQAAITEKFIVR